MKQFSLWLFMLGFLALSLGGLIYVVFRPEGSSYLNVYLNFYQPLPYIPFINNLPSFFHTFAFSLLLISVLRQARYIFLSCLFWFLLNTVFEVSQHASVQHFLENKTLPLIIKRYAYGTFDVLDIVASAVGGLLAYVGFRFWNKEGI